MRLPNDAPIIAVPMCVKHIGGQDSTPWARNT